MPETYTICACIGPAFGEPFCACEMRAKGLPFNEEARAESAAKLDEALTKLVERRKARERDANAL
jgi:hypothetical protein